MRIFDTYDDPEKPTKVRIRAPVGYLITEGTPRLALYCASAQNVTLTATTIDVIDAGLTLDEAHAALTDGLTKEELVELGDDLGLTLSESWLKAKLLDAILNHLEGLS